MSGSTGLTTDQMQQAMQQIQNQQNQNQVQMFKSTSDNSFAQSLAQTIAQIGENAAKNKPQV